jgi:hypothetical protein
MMTTAKVAKRRGFMLAIRPLPPLFVGDSEWSGSLRFIMVLDYLHFTSTESIEGKLHSWLDLYLNVSTEK